MLPIHSCALGQDPHSMSACCFRHVAFGFRVEGCGFGTCFSWQYSAFDVAYAFSASTTNKLKSMSVFRIRILKG